MTVLLYNHGCYKPEMYKKTQNIFKVKKKFYLCKFNLWKQTKEKLKFNIIEGCKKVLEA